MSDPYNPKFIDDLVKRIEATPDCSDLLAFQREVLKKLVDLMKAALGDLELLAPLIISPGDIGAVVAWINNFINNTLLGPYNKAMQMYLQLLSDYARVMNALQSKLLLITCVNRSFVGFTASDFANGLNPSNLVNSIKLDFPSLTGSTSPITWLNQNISSTNFGSLLNKYNLPVTPEIVGAEKAYNVAVGAEKTKALQYYNRRVLQVAYPTQAPGFSVVSGGEDRYFGNTEMATTLFGGM